MCSGCNCALSVTTAPDNLRAATFRVSVGTACHTGPLKSADHRSVPAHPQASDARRLDIQCLASDVQDSTRAPTRPAHEARVRQAPAGFGPKVFADVPA